MSPEIMIEACFKSIKENIDYAEEWYKSNYIGPAFNVVEETISDLEVLRTYLEDKKGEDT